MPLYCIETVFTIDSDALNGDALDDLIDALAPYAGSIGTSTEGNARALFSLDADTVPAALTAAGDVLGGLGIEVLCVEIAPQAYAEARDTVTE